MSNKKLGAVVVGTGFGILTHARALKAAGFDLKALVGRNSQKTAERAKGAGIPLGLTSLSEALALPGVDAVAIATPPHTHAAIALEAIAAGKHVVCEKPFAKNADEAQQMLDAAEAAGIVHILGAEFRWATGQALATKALQDGLIGKPRLANMIMLLPMLADASTEVPEWWGDEAQGGGWLGAYASHAIDHLQQMFGNFSGVSASLSMLSDHEWSADDSYSIHFRTQGGVDGVMQSSIAALGSFQSSFRIVGSQGSLWMEGEKVFIADASGQRELEPESDMLNDQPVPPPGELLVSAYDMLHSMGSDLAPYTKLFETFGEQIRGVKSGSSITAATFVDGLALQKVLDAVRLSSKERRWVSIN